MKTMLGGEAAPRARGSALAAAMLCMKVVCRKVRRFIRNLLYLLAGCLGGRFFLQLATRGFRQDAPVAVGLRGKSLAIRVIADHQVADFFLRTPDDFGSHEHRVA